MQINLTTERIADNADLGKYMHESGIQSYKVYTNVPKQNTEGGLRKPFHFMDSKSENEGRFYTSKSSGERFRVIEYNNSRDITIQFDSGYIAEHCMLHNIKKGLVKNYYTPSTVHGGYLGEGPYKTTDIMHKIWDDMRRRCALSTVEERYSCYAGVTVDSRWDCYQNFADWAYKFMSQLPNKNVNYHIDKDIHQYFVTKVDKVYGPDTCAFVPLKLMIILYLFLLEDRTLLILRVDY